MDRLVESSATLQRIVSSQIRQVAALKSELQLNFEVVEAAIARGGDDHIAKPIAQPASSRAYVEDLRRSRGLNPFVGPDDAKAQERALHQQTLLTNLVEDISTTMQTFLNGGSRARRSLSFGVVDSVDSVKYLIALNTIFRTTLKSVVQYSSSDGWSMETCWKGAMLVHECAIARQKAFANKIQNQIQDISLSGSPSESSATPTFALQSARKRMTDDINATIHLDVYKSTVERLQNELHEMKGLNIALKKRVETAEVITRQRLSNMIEHEYRGPGGHRLRPDSIVLDNSLERRSSVPGGQAKFMPVMQTTTKISGLARSSSRKSINSERTIREQTSNSQVHPTPTPVMLSTKRGNADVNISTGDPQPLLFTTQSIGMERIAWPSSTVNPVALDLTLERLPQVVRQALASLDQASQDDQYSLSHSELNDLIIEIFLSKAQEHGYYYPASKAPSDIRREHFARRQMPEFLSVFFVMKYNVRDKADIEMGRFLAALRKANDNVRATKSFSSTQTLSEWAGQFCGLTPPALPLFALDIMLFAFVRWHRNPKAAHLQSNALNALVCESNTILCATKSSQNSLTDVDSPSSSLADDVSPAQSHFPNLEALYNEKGDSVLNEQTLSMSLIPLQLAKKILHSTRSRFRFSQSAIDVANNQLDADSVLADGSRVGETETRILLTLQRIHEAILNRFPRTTREISHDIESLFRRFDPRRSGRVAMMQFISSIRSLKCGITDEETTSVVKLFDTRSTDSNDQQVDYRKFVKFFAPVMLFVSQDSMISSLMTMWTLENNSRETACMRHFVTLDFKQRINQLSEFKTIIETMRRDVDEYQSAIFFQECLDISGKSFITRQSFLNMARSNGLFFLDRPGIAK